MPGFELVGGQNDTRNTAANLEPRKVQGKKRCGFRSRFHRSAVRFSNIQPHRDTRDATAHRTENKRATFETTVHRTSSRRDNKDKKPRTARKEISSRAEKRAHRLFHGAFYAPRAKPMRETAQATVCSPWCVTIKLSKTGVVCTMVSGTVDPSTFCSFMKKQENRGG